MNKLFLLQLLILLQANLLAQTGAIKGQIKDGETGETLPGCAILIQGTSKGVVTDLDGNYLIENLTPGNYNLVISYISYDNFIQKVTVQKGVVTNASISMKPSAIQMDAVSITAERQTNTELSLMMNMKESDLLQSGISSEQITKSQDNNATEVIRRVPGISIRDGRFVIVRGLSERYNSVWLNNASTPSSEIDKRAFSFDAIPSNLIENINIYKTPAPELPADFAGAMINIKTKNYVDKNAFTISFNGGYNSRTTFREFYNYKGGKTDALGFDDGTRAMPTDFPDTKTFRSLSNNATAVQKNQLTDLGQEFSKIWTPEKTTARPDYRLMANIQRRFTLGKLSVGNITGVTYSNVYSNQKIFRATYENYDTIQDQVKYSYKFNDRRYSNDISLGAISNWMIIFGKNQKIEFRNLFNQLGTSTTTLRQGENHYGGNLEKSYELAYQSRSTYTGQLSGDHGFSNGKSNVDWTIGYSYGNKVQPDIRRVTATKDIDAPDADPYKLSVNFIADPVQMGRIFLTNNENIYVAAANYKHKFQIGEFKPELKTGFYTEYKDRTFVARSIGFAQASTLKFDYTLTQLPSVQENGSGSGEPFSTEFFNRINEVMVDEHINSTNGFKIDESTNPSDSYDANNTLLAGYIGVSMPVGTRIKLYPGVRVEHNTQILNGINEVKDTIRVNIDKVDYFPSVNFTYGFIKDVQLRLAAGRTVNRPEFREIAPYSFYNFEERASMYGNDSLQNAYVQNYDARIEWYPGLGEMISLGGFYKKFDHPVEAHLKDFGTGWNYKYFNAENADCFGVEIDVRKSLSELTDVNGFLHYFKDLIFIVNASVIKSRIVNNDPTERDKVRQLQGQSPYLINTGIIYQNDSAGLVVSLMYNRIGERIAYVGDVNNPHVWEQPFNSLDLTLNYAVTRMLTFNLGIKNLLDYEVVMKQYEEFDKDINGDGIGDGMVKREQINRNFHPGKIIRAGLTLNF